MKNHHLGNNCQCKICMQEFFWKNCKYIYKKYCTHAKPERVECLIIKTFSSWALGLKCQTMLHTLRKNTAILPYPTFQSRFRVIVFGRNRAVSGVCSRRHQWLRVRFPSNTIFFFVFRCYHITKKYINKYIVYTHIYLMYVLL